MFCIGDLSAGQTRRVLHEAEQNIWGTWLMSKMKQEKIAL